MKITDVTPPETFRGWLSHHLKAKGWSQRRVAREAGVHPSAVSRLLREGRDPTLETARKIARVLEARLPE